MDCLESLERRFPERAGAIRHRMQDDSAFRELCTDYEEAAAALDYWQSPPQRSEAKTREYRDLLAELAAEIAAALGDI